MMTKMRGMSWFLDDHPILNWATFHEVDLLAAQGI